MHFVDALILRDIVFNDGLKHIRDHAFQRCISLRGITLPSTVIEIGVDAFTGCAHLRDVVLNDGIKRIQAYAFGECSSLERITIPSTVVEIGQNVFYNCTSLRDVELNVNNGIRTTGHDVLHDATVVNTIMEECKLDIMHLEDAHRWRASCSLGFQPV